jgi:antitoxin HigA-1
MAISNKVSRALRPTHPGEMLREDFMVDYGLTVATLAKALGASRQTVNELFHFPCASPLTLIILPPPVP